MTDFEPVRGFADLDENGRPFVASLESRGGDIPDLWYCYVEASYPGLAPCFIVPAEPSEAMVFRATLSAQSVDPLCEGKTCFPRSGQEFPNHCRSGNAPNAYSYGDCYCERKALAVLQSLAAALTSPETAK